jgi:transposase
MAMGKRETEQQQDLFITYDRLPRSPGHVFYQKLNGLLRDADFDPWVENLCEPHYASGRGRPSVPPGVYFRMLLVGYFEGIGSQRGIAWRCSDSLSLRDFLGIAQGEESPDHSSLSYIRNRLPLEVHQAVFVRILALAEEKKLLKGKTVAVDSTTLEANAAMKSIVRRDTGEDWNDYLARLMQEQGLIAAGDERPSDEQLRKFDKARKSKKVSNDEWESPTDPDSRIARMKDGTTHLAYKAEHVIDLDTEIILAAEIYHADFHDAATLEDSLHQAQINQQEAGSEQEIKDAVADKGYHSTETLTNLDQHTTYRSYVAEPKSPHDRDWTDKPPEQKRAVCNNRRRNAGDRGKKLQRLRSERVERSFAHVCETGGARRTWLVGIDKVRKRYLMSVAAHNLGVMMRSLFKMGTPRGLQQYRQDLEGLVSSLHLAWLAMQRHWTLAALLADASTNPRAATMHEPAPTLAA